MKRYRVSLVFLCISVHGLLLGNAIDSEYEYEALLWTHKVSALHLSSEEEILVANLLYFSAERSRILLGMQEATVHYLQLMSTVVNDAMPARLNPARMSAILNYSTSQWYDKANALEQAQKNFLDIMVSYRYICATYAQCIEYILKNNIFRYKLDQEIRILRDSSRKARMHKFKESALSIQVWMDNLNQLMASFNGSSISREIISSFFDYIIDFTQPALLHSFVKFDKRYNAFNEHGWKTMITSYTLGNLIWKTLEEARHEFYTVYYETFIKERGTTTFPIAFNEEGFITPDERHDWFL